MMGQYPQISFSLFPQNTGDAFEAEVWWWEELEEETGKEEESRWGRVGSD